MSQSFYARTSDHGFETCVEHLSMVAALSGAFAATFDQLDEGLIAGLYHDEGKYSDAFQQRIRDPEHTAKCDHSSAGALKAWQSMHNIAALAIAAHHAGLTDMGTPGDIDDATWFARYNRIKNDVSMRDADERMTGQFGAITPSGTPTPGEPYDIMMQTRMILSCLVDADRLDAEYFVENGCERSERRWMDFAHATLGGNNMAQEHAPNITTITACAQQLADMMHQHHNDVIASLTNIINKQNARYLDAVQSSPINAARSDILRQCRNYGQNPQHGRDIYTLTAPTGSGKTNASITFALNHAKTHGLDRIIYVIPYMSIIDQTAKTFAQIFGDDNVLAHYSQADWQTGNDDTSADKQIMAENWNAPIVVTTAVQFFESLYGNKTSPLRKLHNITNSVIVFDEAQTLPVPYLLPCLKAICSLIDDYSCSAVLCTATQPAISDYISDMRPNTVVKEITNISDAQRHLFDRTRIEFTGTVSQPNLADQIAAQTQALCVVNTRDKAQSLYTQVKQRCGNDDDIYCLTTLQCAYDRQQLIEEIRTKLTTGQTCRVISTSLIEAGVDLDFPRVWRQNSGVENILQAAGRCNREGKRNADTSIVTVFEDNERIPRYIRQNIDATMLTRNSYTDISDNNAITAYFKTLYTLKGDTTLDKHHILDQSQSPTMPWALVANDMHIIDNNDDVTVYIPRNATAKQLLNQLQYGMANRTTMRQLSVYGISIPRWQFDKISNAVRIVEMGKTGDTIAILNDPDMYHPRQGLMVPNNTYADPNHIIMF